MKILLSVFSCAPNTGSEAGGGWTYAIKLASMGHEVWALTDDSRRASIEAYADTLPGTLHIEYYRPRLLKALKLNSKTAHLIYQGWQMGAWRVAQALDARHNFDVCWHLSYGVFRQPSWMWKVGKPFVFGPVGGGERAPVRLWRGMSFTEQLREAMRDTINNMSWFLPGLRATYRHAAMIITRTEDTRAVLPLWAQDKTAVQQEIGGYPARASATDKSGHSGHLKILFAGRLLGWKGVHLAIAAFKKFLESGGKGELTIIGEGPMAGFLKKLALPMSGLIQFVNKLPQEELFRRYQKYDVLLFPSVHDSGGNVVIEALSFGVPVVCLDLGGPRCFVDESCGIVVPTAGAGPEKVSDELAAALMRLYEAPALHQRLCSGALQRADAMTWDRQIERVFALVEDAASR